MHFDSRDEAIVNQAFNEVLAFNAGFNFPHNLLAVDIMTALVAAHQASDEYFTSRHTAAWDTTFVIPPEALASDAALFRQCNKDFPTMCRHKQALLASNRLSLDRLHSIFGSDGQRVPGIDLRDFNILCEFATQGITPPVSANFQPQSQNIPPLRDRYIKLQHPINRLLYKQYTDGTMILLSLKDAKSIPGIHFSPQHHADSKGKPEGRVIGDLSGQHDPSYTPLNGSAEDKDALRVLISSQWGEIKHPTVDQLVLMVLTSADLYGWDNIILWKKDLKGAFNLLNYNPDHCRLFAFPLIDDIVVIHLAGLFGWIGMPHAFQVLTRALHALCQHIISGLCYWYVDDLMAVSRASLYTNDSTVVDAKVQQLLGLGSIAAAKSQVDRCLEFLGWSFNLDTRTITLCARNMNKFVHALFSFNPAEKISISHIQRIASLMSRTSILSRHMRPYTHAMHVITSGYTQPHARILLSDLAQSDIMMWRAFVLLLIAQPERLSRTMESFRPQSAQYCIKYDASLTGLGVGIYNLSTSELITYTAMSLPFEVTNESKRQNTMEFIAVVLGLLLAWRASLHHFTYNLHGDSISSLAWAKTDRVNSILARQANIVYTTISVHLLATVAETVHIPGTLNVIFDGLSRGLPPRDLGLDESKMYPILHDAAVTEFIMMCDPSAELTNMHSHTNLLHRCTVLLN